MTWTSPDGRVVLHHGDCLDILSALPPEAQLIVTSPPYNVQRDYGLGGEDDRLPLPEYLDNLCQWIAAMRDILRPGGVLALNVPFGISTGASKPGRFSKARSFRGRNDVSRRSIDPIHDTWSTFPIAAWCEMAVIEAGFLPRRSITWAKGPEEGAAYATSLAMGNVANPFPRPASERIVLASKGKYGRNGTIRRLHPAEHIDWLKDVWWISAYSRGTGPQRPWEAGGHPCPFPTELPRRCILLFSEPDDLVVDPFVGSGTTGEVARQLGRRFIGIDTNADYLKYAKERVMRGPRAASKIVDGQGVLL